MGVQCIMTTLTTKIETTISKFPSETPVGMCYVPFQQWETPYAENTALEIGTMFPSLNLPFLGKEVDTND